MYSHEKNFLNDLDLVDTMNHRLNKITLNLSTNTHKWIPMLIVQYFIITSLTSSSEVSYDKHSYLTFVEEKKKKPQKKKKKTKQNKYTLKINSVCFASASRGRIVHDNLRDTIRTLTNKFRYNIWGVTYPTPTSRQVCTRVIYFWRTEKNPRHRTYGPVPLKSKVATERGQPSFLPSPVRVHHRLFYSNLLPFCWSPLLVVLGFISSHTPHTQTHGYIHTGHRLASTLTACSFA